MTASQIAIALQQAKSGVRVLVRTFLIENVLEDLSVFVSDGKRVLHYELVTDSNIRMYQVWLTDAPCTSAPVASVDNNLFQNTAVKVFVKTAEWHRAP